MSKFYGEMNTKYPEYEDAKNASKLSGGDPTSSNLPQNVVTDSGEVLETIDLTYESYEPVELSQQASELDILECLTPAPYQFTDDVEFLGESRSRQHSHINNFLHPDTVHSNDDLTQSGASDTKYMKNGGKTMKTYHKEVHPHSRSTETILFHNDKDANPMVPNKKPGTPDIWLPRTIRA